MSVEQNGATFNLWPRVTLGARNSLASVTSVRSEYAHHSFLLTSFRSNVEKNWFSLGWLDLASVLLIANLHVMAADLNLNLGQLD